MNVPDLVNQCSIDENEGSNTKYSLPSVSSVDGETSSDGQQTSDEQSSDPERAYTCKRPECENLIFTTESDWHRHLVEHIGLPTINVRRLSESEQKKLLKKRQRSGHKGAKAGPHSRTKTSSRKSKTEPLTPLRVKKISADSDERVFEVVKPTKILYGPGGVYCSNGVLDLKEEVEDKGVSSGETPNFPAGGCSRRVELDAPRNEEDGVEAEAEDRLDEESESTQDDGEGGCSEDGGTNDEGGDLSTWDQDQHEGETPPTLSTPSRANSPTPSEVLRPSGLLAPEQFGDEDSCYPNSPPESESSGRMVELNGSGAGVGGSDNDSGHSRSPATFPGTGGGSEDDIQDSSQPNFNWDDIVGGSAESTSANADNDSENADSGAGDLVQSNDLESETGSVASLDTGSLLLNDGAGSQTTAPTISVRDLQEFRSPNFSSNDAGQGDTEYMSLERLGESQVSCEVCGERAPSRQSLEEHRAVAGHYKCMIDECGSVVGSAGDLAAHQTSVHGGQPQLPAQPSPPVSAGPGTPPVQQLAQQVQRLPIPQQQAQPGMVPPYPGMVPPPLAPSSYPVPQSLSPHQQQLGMVAVPQSLSPQQQQQAIAPANAQQFRRGPAYRASQQPMQPFGPGSPSQGQPQAVGNQGYPGGPGPYPGQIQPRPLNTLVAPQQPIQRAPMQVRMAAPGVMLPQRGMVPSVRAQKRLAPVPPAGRGGPQAQKQRRVDVIPVAEVPAPGKKSDAKAVANILATRGITVTPAGVTRPGLTVQQVTGPQPGRARGQPIQPAQAQAPQPVTTLNLNSAISITPTGANNVRQQNSGFVVPHGRSVRSQPQTTNVERPPRPPTVDLTGDGPTPPPGSTRLQMAPMVHRGRGRPSQQQRTTCQICDKAFTTPEHLAQHMIVHRNPGKLPFRCNLCNAQYPTQQGLTQHRQTYHKESAGVGMGPALVPGEEMVIPLVDLKQPGVAARLGALGIHHCIPLSGLGNQSNGFFHLPVVSIDGSRTAAASNLRSLGASGVLSIGPIKLVPRGNQ